VGVHDHPSSYGGAAPSTKNNHHFKVPIIVTTITSTVHLHNNMKLQEVHPKLWHTFTNIPADGEACWTSVPRCYRLATERLTVQIPFRTTRHTVDQLTISLLRPQLSIKLKRRLLHWMLMHMWMRTGFKILLNARHSGLGGKTSGHPGLYSEFAASIFFVITSQYDRFSGWDFTKFRMWISLSMCTLKTCIQCRHSRKKREPQELNLIASLKLQ